jgi:hypothetical protein
MSTNAFPNLTFSPVWITELACLRQLNLPKTGGPPSSTPPITPNDILMRLDSSGMLLIRMYLATQNAANKSKSA